MAEEESVNNNSVNWNVDSEVSLFHAMHDHKPVGVNRHFQMIFIHDKLNSSVSKKIPVDEIWKHLSELYDLQALHDSERLPFPNKDLDFVLPSSPFDDLIKAEFPRLTETATKAELQTKDGPTANVVDSKEFVDAKTPGVAAKTSKSSAAAAGDEVTPAIEKPTDVTKTEENVKGTSRKRTRHSLQNPAESNTPSTGSTPTGAKRPRRI